MSKKRDEDDKEKVFDYRALAAKMSPRGAIDD